MPKVALVTDSTAALPEWVVAEHGIQVVPMRVSIAGRSYDECTDMEATPSHVAEALRARLPVTTSRPTPAALLAAYQRAAETGAQEVVSVHISAEISGTFESAVVAARESPVPVVPVDSRQVGQATGYAVLAAASALRGGASAGGAAEAALVRALATASLFCVDTLEHLRRGGRVGAASAVFGTALAVKPLLHVVDGRVERLEKLRTAGRALARLEQLAVDAAADRPVEAMVCHLDNADRAARLARQLETRLGGRLCGRAVEVAEVSAVVGAHTGPGLVGVVVAPAI
jgi:DegV family protein with EDD domain